jgi:FMN phosphatase YigB (HAD superfamily)
MRGVDTILFDLDGTLLPMEMNVFLRMYFYEVGRAFTDMSDPKTFVSHLLEATQFMLNNDGKKTNSEVFAEKFSRKINGQMDIYLERFEKFYDEGYLNLKNYVYPNPLVKKAVETLKNKGYKLVIATNPIFPQKAVIHRVSWAGLNPSDFIYITSFEKSRYCKPNINFFLEVLDSIGKEAYHCLMVGNDVQEDLAAYKAGMHTYLITDHMINRNEEKVISTFTGDYKEFFGFVEKLPCVV